MAQMDDWRLYSVNTFEDSGYNSRKYKAYSEEWTHDHCAPCWATFSELDGPKIVHEGYATTDDYKHGAEYDWVCVPCFSELREILDWTAVE